MRPNKRELLLETAEWLFYTEGFHATGIDRVVAEAGVARMTLYNHFDSKEELVEAVLRRRFARYLDDLRETIDRRPGPAVTTLATRHGEWLLTESTHGCIVVKAIGEFERHHPPIADLGRELKQELLDVVRAALERDGYGDDTERAGCILVALEGADALAPVLGAQRVVSHLNTMIPAILETSAEV